MPLDCVLYGFTEEQEAQHTHSKHQAQVMLCDAADAKGENEKQKHVRKAVY